MSGKARRALAICLLGAAACGRPSAAPPGGSAEAELLPASAYDTFSRLYHRVMAGEPPRAPAFTLAEPGDSQPVDYARFGRFIGVGTPQYRYELRDEAGLKRALGEGIPPNEEAVLRDPAYERLRRAGRLDSGLWQAVGSPDAQAAFFICSRSHEPAGVRCFFTGMILERAGLLLPALKAYYAAVVQHPGAYCWSRDGNWVWFVAPAALGAIDRICRDRPELGVRLAGASVRVANGGDTDTENDVVTVNPGRWVRATLADRRARLPDLAREPIVAARGRGRVQLLRRANGHWEMRVDGRPFLVRGITYMPTEIGFGPKSDPNFGLRWMFTDKDRNGRIDAAYDAWVDADGDGRRDRREPVVGDFALLRDMGVNAIRLFGAMKPDRITYDSAAINKPLLRELHDSFGIGVIMTDCLGAYTLGSGADWHKGTDYTDPAQRARMKESVRQMVMDLKDERFLLLWVLGNENNMSGDYTGVNATRTNAASQPRAYAELLNEVATMIHEIDPDHPVAVGNVELGLADAYSRHAPALDILGVNSYRGAGGFGDLFVAARAAFDRPVLITEYGSDCFHSDSGYDPAAQALYHAGCLRDIIFNQAGGEYGGNCIGGVIFEWLDEWWKDTHSGDSESSQRKVGQFAMPFADGVSQEEWLGIVGQGSGRRSPFERQLRPAYAYYRDMWTGDVRPE